MTVTQAGVGDALFKLSDIFTATLAVPGDPYSVIYGLAGASIRIQKDTLNVSQTLTTDRYGEVTFTDLSSGFYTFRATAPNHQEETGRLTIKPGITVAKELFLDYNLITVDWNVREITIEDRYDIDIKVVYETKVPAAVVVMEPAGVSLPLMQPGQVLYGEIKMTNYGLIRADNLLFTPPSSDAYFKFELLLDGIPDTLYAGQSIIVPYRVTSLSSLVPSMNGLATGAGTFNLYPAPTVKPDGSQVYIV